MHLLNQLFADALLAKFKYMFEIWLSNEIHLTQSESGIPDQSVIEIAFATP